MKFRNSNSNSSTHSLTSISTSVLFYHVEHRHEKCFCATTPARKLASCLKKKGSCTSNGSWPAAESFFLPILGRRRLTSSCFHFHQSYARRLCVARMDLYSSFRFTRFSFIPPVVFAPQFSEQNHVASIIFSSYARCCNSPGIVDHSLHK